MKLVEHSPTKFILTMLGFVLSFLDNCTSETNKTLSAALTKAEKFASPPKSDWDILRTICAVILFSASLAVVLTSCPVNS